MTVTSISPNLKNIQYYDERVDLAASFRWAVKHDMHEGVANHFKLSIESLVTAV